MPGVRNSFSSVKGTDSAKLSSLQRSTSSSRSRTPARLATKRQLGSSESTCDIAGISICSTSGRDIIMAKSALHALDKLQSPQPQATYGLVPTGNLGTLNHSIKMAASWEAIQTLLNTATANSVTASNTSYALFRLGCMSCLAAPQKQAQIKASGLIEHLFALTHEKLSDCGSHELTHVMDACARLRHRPPSYILQAIASQAQIQAASFTSQQLPLLLWGFATVGYKPEDVVQQVLNQAVQREAAGFSPQGVSLCLWAYASLHHVPAESVLHELCSNWTRNLQHFKPHELANCLEACAALSYDPGHTVLDAIASRMGRSSTANQVQGRVSSKPSLTPGPKRISIPSSPSAGHLSGLIRVTPATSSGSAPAV